MTQDRIQSETGKAYFSQIPHILFDYDLSHTEFRLWCYYNRHGECQHTIEETSRGAKISTGAVSIAKKLLLEKGMIHDGFRGIYVTPPENWKSKADQKAIKTQKMLQRNTPQKQKRGWVYIVKIDGDNLYKIGMTTKSPKRRIASFSPKIPYQTTTVTTKETGNPFWLESQMHKMASDCRVNGEWFRLTDDTLQDILNYLSTIKE